MRVLRLSFATQSLLGLKSVTVVEAQVHLVGITRKPEIDA